MAPQSVFLQVGQCGNQMGSRFWERALEEHATYNSNAVYDSAIACLFRNLEHQKNGLRRYSEWIHAPGICRLEARGVMVDTEEGVLHDFARLPVSELFCAPHQQLTASGGSGNNWAVGYTEHGPAFRERLENSLRKEAEQCDSMQAVIMIHSLGGGTGSGLGAYTMRLASEMFPHVLRMSVALLPSAPHDDVVTSPYNAALALSTLAEDADCILACDNSALAAHTVSYNDQSRPFSCMNDVVAQSLVHLTASMRYQGPLNVDFNELSTNLVPFPSTKLITASFPQPSQQPQSISKATFIAPPVQKHVAPRTYAKSLVANIFSPRSQLLSVDPRNGTFLSCALLARGATALDDIIEGVEKLAQSSRFAWWNQNGWKTASCALPPVNSPCGLLFLANTTSVASSLSVLKHRFLKLYSRKANLHHYTRHIELDMFDSAMESLSTIMDSYNSVSSETPEGTMDSSDWLREIYSTVRTKNIPAKLPFRKNTAQQRKRKDSFFCKSSF